MIPFLSHRHEERLISGRRAFLVSLAVALGLSIGSAASGRVAVLAVLAALIAAMNGYAKAHSP